MALESVQRSTSATFSNPFWPDTLIAPSLFRQIYLLPSGTGSVFRCSCDRDVSLAQRAFWTTSRNIFGNNHPVNAQSICIRSYGRHGFAIGFFVVSYDVCLLEGYQKLAVEHFSRSRLGFGSSNKVSSRIDSNSRRAVGTNISTPSIQ